jgi:hypothetical protein
MIRSFSCHFRSIDRHSRRLNRHSRAGGNPGAGRTRTLLDSRLRGNDGRGSPQEIVDEIAALDAESAEVLTTIRGLL